MGLGVLLWANLDRGDGKLSGEAEVAGCDHGRQKREEGLHLLVQFFQAVVDVLQLMRLRQETLFAARQAQIIVRAFKLRLQIAPTIGKAFVLFMER